MQHFRFNKRKISKNDKNITSVFQESTEDDEQEPF